MKKKLGYSVTGLSVSVRPPDFYTIKLPETYNKWTILFRSNPTLRNITFSQIIITFFSLKANYIFLGSQNKLLRTILFLPVSPGKDTYLVPIMHFKDMLKEAIITEYRKIKMDTFH